MKILILILLIAFVPMHGLKAQSPQEFEQILDRLGPFPSTLVSKEGDLYHFSVQEYDQGNKVIRFLDHEGNNQAEPDQIIIHAMPEQPGEYAVFMLQNGQISGHIGVLSDGTFQLGPPIHNLTPNGPVTPLYDRHLMFAQLDKDDQSYLRIVELVEQDGVLSSKSSPIVRFDQSMHILGPVRHPISGEAGVAIGDRKKLNDVVLYFPGEAPIRLTFPKRMIAFKAQDARVLIGSLRKECNTSENLPNGLCTPDLFAVPIAGQNTSYTLDDRLNFTWVAKSFPDWTFGANNIFRSMSDFQLVGDRLFVVAYRGPKQMVLEYDLTKEANPTVRIQPRDGVEIDFGAVSGPKGGETVAVNIVDYLTPRETLGLRVGKPGFEEFVRSKPYPEIAELDLQSGTFDTVPGLPPFTVVSIRPDDDQDFCQGGRALIEVYGGAQIPLKPYNIVGFVPGFLDERGVYIAAHIQGGGGYGQSWYKQGAYANAVTQSDQIISLVQQFRSLGCDDITLYGASYGGGLALRTAIQHPNLINRAIVANSSLDYEKAHSVGNRSIASHLPRNWNMLKMEDFARVSPKHLAESADDLSGLDITLITGERDAVVVTDKDADAINLFREKGATVELIVRPGIGHSKHNNRTQWAEYYHIISKALKVSDTASSSHN